MLGNAGMMNAFTRVALPVGGGIATGLMIPKAFPKAIAQNPWMKYLIQGITGVVAYMAGKPLLGQSNAMLFSGSVFGTMILTIVDDIVLAPMGQQVMSDLPQYTLTRGDVVDELSDVPGTGIPNQISQNDDLLMENAEYDYEEVED
jgi:hypothetical protein